MEAADPLELGDIAREIQGIADELAARREAKACAGFHRSCCLVERNGAKGTAG
jgi:hypothetical protein